MSTKTITRGADSDVDRFIKESCKSYKECNVKNHARRNSLQRRTLGIESERRLASAKLSREERMLREQLKQMNIEKAKHHIIHNLRESSPKKKGKKKVAGKVDAHLVPIEPYPVTFRVHTPSPTELDKDLESAGRKYASGRRRRQSKEFEDLHVDTGSGSLYHIHEEDEDMSSPRPRVYSMSYANKIMARKHLGTSCHSSAQNSPRTSPSLRRRVLSKRKGCNSSGSSHESLSDSSDRFTSLDDLHWVGEPEAIHSVRRARKTVEEQELEAEMHKLII